MENMAVINKNIVTLSHMACNPTQQKYDILTKWAKRQMILWVNTTHTDIFSCNVIHPDLTYEDVKKDTIICALC